MKYYERLKDAREDKDLKQKDIAKLLDTSVSAISDYENGKNMMGIDKYIKLAKHYNLSIDFLAGIIDKPKKLYEDKKSESIEFTEEDIKLIQAYKAKPELQLVVNKILDI